MKIPEFKPSRRFLGEYDVPCLVAECKNSDVPGVAKKYIAETSKDPIFPIYLRGKKSKQVSPWMQAKQRELFEQNGLVAAVAEGLRELPDDCFVSMDKDERRDLEAHGFHPHVYITRVVIDEIRRKVLVGISDIFVLIEHGGVIYSKAGNWHFAEGEHWIAYEAAFEKHRIPEDTSAVDEAHRQFEEKWDELFPPPARNIPAESAATVLCGVWEINKGETLKLLKRLNCPDGEFTGQEILIAQKIGLWFSTEAIEELSSGYTATISTIISCERRGNWFALEARMIKGGEHIWEPIYWCDGEQLIEKRGKSIFTRVADACRKGRKMGS